jgi:hypothetical protein
MSFLQCRISPKKLLISVANIGLEKFTMSSDDFKDGNLF